MSKESIQNAIDTATSALTLASSELAALSLTAPSAPTWPTPMDCFGGTVPSAIVVDPPDVPGDGVPGGKLPEPYWTRNMTSLPPGTGGFFGDSMGMVLFPGAIHPALANYCLGGQSTRRMINGMPSHTFMRTGGFGVIMTGPNDFGNTALYGPRTNGSAVANVLAMFSNKLKPFLRGKWVICHLVPTTAAAPNVDTVGYKQQVDAFNSGIANAMAGSAAQIAYATVNPLLLDANGYLKPEHALASDGQHYSPSGAALRVPDVRTAVQSLGL